MRKTHIIVGVVLILFALAAVASAQCVKIQSGALAGANGVVLKLGYDQWGYNYQAHMFNGLSENYSRPTTPVTEGLDSLVMKWSDDWLANVDCNSDGKLDRGLNPKTGESTGVSVGWVTNHYEGDYYGDDGELHHYTYFVKIAYVGPVVATPDPWADKRIWGLYAIIEEVNNDPYGGFHGVTKDKLVHPGLGLY